MLTLNAPLDLPSLAPRLRWIQAIGSGVGQFVPSRLPDGGITLTNAAGVGAAPIAEWVLARILVGLQAPRRARRAAACARVAGVDRRADRRPDRGRGRARRDRYRGRRPGCACSACMSSVFGGTPGDATAVDELVGPDQLHDVLGRARTSSSWPRPGPRRTRTMFDAAAFAAMRRGALFVNVARGSLVDEDALVAALRSGHLRAAARIDVRVRNRCRPTARLGHAQPRDLTAQLGVGRPLPRTRRRPLLRQPRRYVAGQELRNVVDLSAGYGRARWTLGTGVRRAARCDLLDDRGDMIALSRQPAGCWRSSSPGPTGRRPIEELHRRALGGSSSTSAGERFHMFVSRMRKAAGAETVASDASGYRVAFDLDVDQFFATMLEADDASKIRRRRRAGQRRAGHEQRRGLRQFADDRGWSRWIASFAEQRRTAKSSHQRYRVEARTATRSSTASTLRTVREPLSGGPIEST